MPKVTDATAYRVGGSTVSKLYAGSTQVWSSAPPPSPEVIAATNGNTSGTSATITLPARETGDYLTLLVASNQAPTLGFSAGVASFQVLSSAASRLQALRIVPTAGATQVTLTSSVTAVLTWWCASWRNVDPNATIDQATSSSSTNTTAAIDSPTVSLGHIATGREIYVRAASVNATATWTTTPSTIFATTSGNAAMSVRSDQVTAGVLAIPAASSFDRGLEGTNRIEASLVFVLQPVQTVVNNMLTNGSFETALGNGVATGWETEGTAPRLPTCSLSGSGVVDGGLAQRFQFTGTVGDSGNVAIYQAPITVNPGDVVRATIYLSGTLTNAYAIFGIEGFVTGGGQYIDEHDTVINAGALTATPTKYTVEYTCPGNCTAVAVYFQTPALAPTSVVDVYMDKAILTKG